MPRVVPNRTFLTCVKLRPRTVICVWPQYVPEWDESPVTTGRVPAAAGTEHRTTINPAVVIRASTRASSFMEVS